MTEDKEYTYFMGLLSTLLLTKGGRLRGPGTLMAEIPNASIGMVNDIIRAVMDMPFGVRDTWFRWEMEALLACANELILEEVDSQSVML